MFALPFTLTISLFHLLEWFSHTQILKSKPCAEVTLLLDIKNCGRLLVPLFNHVVPLHVYLICTFALCSSKLNQRLNLPINTSPAVFILFQVFLGDLKRMPSIHQCIILLPCLLVSKFFGVWNILILYFAFIEVVQIHDWTRWGMHEMSTWKTCWST